MGAVEPSRHVATGPSDAALVVAARAGEAWACEALYRRHVAVAHGLACRMIGRDVDVDDLLQDCFVAAFGALDRLEDGGLFRAWLCGIVVRSTTKVIRRRRLLARLGLRTAAPSVDLDRLLAKTTPPDVAAELRQLYRALETIPADLRTVLLLRRVEGARLEEIAEMTRSSLATVKRRLAKGGALLRAAVGEEGHDE